MGKTTNLTQCECDRCGSKEIITKDAPSLKFWHDVKRVSSDGVEIERLLCHSCYQEYVLLQSGQDAAFEAFMENKDE